MNKQFSIIFQGHFSNQFFIASSLLSLLYIILLVFIDPIDTGILIIITAFLINVYFLSAFMIINVTILSDKLIIKRPMRFWRPNELIIKNDQIVKIVFTHFAGTYTWTNFCLQMNYNSSAFPQPFPRISKRKPLAFIGCQRKKNQELFLKHFHSQGIPIKIITAFKKDLEILEKGTFEYEFVK